MSKRKGRVNLSDDDVEYLDALLSGYDDLPDGAWQAVCQELIERCSRFRDHDPYDVWIRWVEKNSAKRSA